MSESEVQKSIYNFLKNFIPGFKKKTRIKNYIKKIWKGKIEKERDFDLISIFFKLNNINKKGMSVDNKTWNDLNMDEIFCEIDRTVSSTGSQYLYNQIRGMKHPEESTKKNDLYRLFIKNTIIREKIQRILYKLNNEEASYIPYLILKKLKVNMHIVWIKDFS